MGLNGGLTLREASAFDFLHALDVTGRQMVRKRRHFGLMARQLAESQAVSLIGPDGALAAIIGLHESEDLPGEAEVWFAVGPALKGNLIRAVSIFANCLHVVGQLAPGLTVTAYIDPRSVAGDRLARLLGFTEAGLTETDIGPLRTWRRTL